MSEPSVLELLAKVEEWLAAERNMTDGLYSDRHWRDHEPTVVRLLSIAEDRARHCRERLSVTAYDDCVALMQSNAESEVRAMAERLRVI